MFKSNPLIGRFIQFFWLPNVYFEIVRFKVCKKSRFIIALDLLKLFFGYKTFPDNYGPCRLWEVEKGNWKYYYGSNYHPHQRSKLRRKVQPSEYGILFDDKAICERLCKDTGVSMPHTYGIIGPDQAYKEKITSWFNESAATTLFIKPLRGRAGLGIVLARRINDDIVIQSAKEHIPLRDFVLKEEAIVQEMMKQDRRMSVFSLSSVNTVRVVTMYTKSDSIIVLTAIMRCGVGESYVDNWSAGGVGIGINYKTGQLNQFGFDKKGNKYSEHPTSRVQFDDFIIPEWERIIDIAVRIQRSFPCYRILGMDIALKEDGEPVLIEINDSPDLLGMEQMCGPLLQVKENLQSFGEYALLVNKHQQKLYRSLINK